VLKKIVLTNKAESDLEAIFEHYCVKVGDEKAGELIQRTIETIEMLGQHPSLGRQAQIPDIRELILTNIPFVVPYRLVGDSIQVLRVIHQHTELAGEW
jgi:plasmid stabilization system protein ParE